jgi:hypothetical protein
MMDEKYIREHDILGRYLRDQLSDREQSDFERYYFEHPETFRELELESTVRDALRGSRGLHEPAEPRESWLVRWLSPIASPLWSASATVAATVLAGLLLYETRMPPDRMSPVVAALQLERLRGGDSEVPSIRLERSGVVSVNIDTSGLDPATIVASLRGPGKGAREMPIVPDESGLARVVLPAESLPPGDYDVDLHDSRGATLSYAFRVDR